jgi:hypothetical protein
MGEDREGQRHQGELIGQRGVGDAAAVPSASGFQLAGNSMKAFLGHKSCERDDRLFYSAAEMEHPIAQANKVTLRDQRSSPSAWDLGFLEDRDRQDL